MNIYEAASEINKLLRRNDDQTFLSVGVVTDPHDGLIIYTKTERPSRTISGLVLSGSYQGYAIEQKYVGKISLEEPTRDTRRTISAKKPDLAKAGTAVILLNEDCSRILVGERKGAHGSGLTAFPGGKLESSDKGLFLSGEREVLEETKIVCACFKPDDVREDLFTTFDILSDDGKDVYLTSYLIARYVSGGEPIPDTNGLSLYPAEPHKCVKWDWVTLSELNTRVEAEDNKSWIPQEKVNFYLPQFMR